jgi:tRNA modification GTPase
VDLVDADGPFDDGIAVYQRAPASFTGEDTLEVTLHGNPLLVERLVTACLAAGAVLAGPGDFTRRAVLSGKLPLLEAEGIDLAIRATSTAGLAIARAAPRLAHHLQGLRDDLVHVTAELEARLDYPADELALEDDDALVARLTDLADRADRLADTHQTGRVLVDGARVALVGAVNAGKSSLFNRLLGRERALVHATAGTTRDVVEARGRLGGLAVTLLDTAGERVTDDPIEAAGLALAAELIADADLLLVVLRAGDGITAAEQAVLERTADRRRLVVLNGIDRPHRPVPDALPVSAHTGEGLDTLRTAITAALIDTTLDPDTIVGTARQASLLRQAADAGRAAVDALATAGVAVAADELVQGLEALDALTGADTREEVLDALFARFCIGK